MSVLVTGGCGYIGAHMVFALRARGEHVVVVDNLTTGFRNALPRDVALVEADIGDAKALAELFGAYSIETIFHFAASTVVPDSVTDPLSYYCNNTSNALNLLAAAVKAGVRCFVQSSTAAVYGAPIGGVVSEETEALPQSPYGASKLFFERMLFDASRAYGMASTILRYFNVAGADPAGRCGQSTPNATHLIKRCVQAAVGLHDGVDVYGTDFDTPDGTGVRDYIHVSDLVDAHLLALDQVRREGGHHLYNCGYGRGFSVRDVISSTKRVSGVDFTVRDKPRRAGDSGIVVARADKLRRELGWSPKFDDLDVIVAHALSWEKRLVGDARSPKGAGG